MALRPFGSADGLVARAAGAWCSSTAGLDPKAVSAPEVGHAELEKFGVGGFAREHGAIEGDAYGLALRAYVSAAPRASRSGCGTARGGRARARARARRCARRSRASSRSRTRERRLGVRAAVPCGRAG
jgi:hypothetical protein